jgi:hypothetical protein
MKTMPREMVVSWVGMLVAGGLLLGCAGGPTSLVKLQEARATLERARHAESPATHAPVREAQGAVEYAEEEYRLSPNHPLAQERAENALEKARAALRATSVSRRALTAAQ